MAFGLEHVVAVIEGQPLFGSAGDRVPRPDLRVGAQSVVFDQGASHVDPEAVDPSFQPETEDPVEFVDHRWVAPVEVGLFGEEQVHVVLARSLVQSPGWATEIGDPVVRRAAVGVRIGPHVVVAVIAVRASEGILKPGVRITGVVGYQVHQNPQSSPVGVDDQVVEVGKGAEAGVDVAVVGDVVAPVGHGRRVERGDPDEVDTQVNQVAEPAADSGQVADAVGVRVGERTDVDLVSDGAMPPRPGSLSPGHCCAFH